jgi:hypothetical protein
MTAPEGKMLHGFNSINDLLRLLIEKASLYAFAWLGFSAKIVILPISTSPFVKLNIINKHTVIIPSRH